LDFFNTFTANQNPSFVKELETFFKVADDDKAAVHLDEMKRYHALVGVLT